MHAHKKKLRFFVVFCLTHMPIQRKKTYAVMCEWYSLNTGRTHGNIYEYTHVCVHRTTMTGSQL